jgi:ADP-ribosylation factor-like protein 2
VLSAFSCWDIGGQSSLRSYWQNYFERTDALVWVVDSTDKKRMKDCRAELDKLLGEECLKGVTLLILANKRDLPNSLSADEIFEVCFLFKILFFAGFAALCSKHI